MHMAMHDWMRVEPPEAAIRRMAEYGYEGYVPKGEPDQYDYDEVNRLLDEYEMSCWGTVTLMFGERNLLAPDEEQRAESVQYVKDCIDMVAALNGEVISVVPGTVGKIEPDASAEEEWQWAVESCKKVYEHGLKQDVEIAIEPINRFETYFINRVDQALALADEVDPNCGVCVDTFHMNIEESEPYEALRTAGDRINDVHIADSNRFAAGMGHWDYARVVDILEEVGYDGALSAEFVAPVDRTPANPYEDAEASETDAVAYSEEEKKFIEDHGGNLVSNEFYTWLTEKNAETILPLIS